VGSGGARNRSGPVVDPGSARSDRRGVVLSALPVDYAGSVPDFPLPCASERELELWAEVWRLPQANAWALPSEVWRQRTVAMWVRLSVRCEDVEAPAALLAQLHRFADQVGLTTAGLAEMGWRIAPDEVGAQRSASDASSGRPKVERRLRAVGDTK
jgi:hypothetical protein